jgi:hypothetical protein
MIILAFFGGILVLGVVAAMFHDRRARRRGLRPGVSPRDIRHGGGGGGVGGVGGP